jgi:hypothetical protein
LSDRSNVFALSSYTSLFAAPVVLRLLVHERRGAEELASRELLVGEREDRALRGELGGVDDDVARGP